MQQRFRVELLVNTHWQSTDTMLVRDVIAKGEHDAVDRAINLLQKEFPTTRWARIEPWHVEMLGAAAC